MILNRITHQGSVAFPDDIIIDFEALPTVVGIHGPNGAGKTTLFDCIVAGLFLTMPFRPGPLHKQFRSRGYIDLLWSPFEDGPRYRSRVNVDPEAEKTEASLFPAEGGPALAGPGQREYVKAVERILGPLAVFLASAYTVQPSYASAKGIATFLQGDRVARRAIMADLLGLRSYPLHEAYCKDCAGKVETTLTQKRAQLADLDGRATRLPDLEGEQAAAHARVDAAQAQVDAWTAKMTTGQEALSAAQTTLAGLRPIQAQKVAADAECRALEGRLATARSRLAAAQGVLLRAPEIEKATGALKAAQQQLAWLDPVKAKLALIQGSLAGLTKSLGLATSQRAEAAKVLGRAGEIEAAVAEERRLTTEAEQLATAAEQAGAEYRAAMTSYAAWRERAMVLEAKQGDVARAAEAAEILTTVPCRGADEFAGCRFLVQGARAATALPQLRAELASTAAGVGDHVDAPTDRAVADIVVRRQRVVTALRACAGLVKLAPALDVARQRDAALAEEERSLAAEIAAQRDGEQQTRGELSAMAELERQIAALAPTAAMSKELDASRAVAAEVAGQIAGIEESLAANVVVSQSCADLLKDLPGLVEHVDALERDRVAHEKTKVQVTWALGAAQQALGGVQAQVAAALEAGAQAEGVRVQLGPLTEDLTDWTLLAKAFSTTGIPTLLVDQALPEIGQLATDLLRECFGASLFTVALTTQKRSADDKKLLETLDVVVQRDAETLPVEVLSGGEGVLVSEALALAIALYNASRSGHHARTLLRDEVGANLDTEAGRSQAYIRMLRRAATIGKFRHVLFVSHERACLDLADARLWVRDGKVSVE